MDALRVWLIVIGILIVAAIYYIGRRQLDAQDRRFKFATDVPWSALYSRLKSRVKQFKQSRMPKQVEHPVLTPEPDPAELDSVDSIVPTRSEHSADIADDVSLIVELTSDQIAPEGEQLFIPLTIIGKHGRRIIGEEIDAAMQACDFVLKETGIYYFEVADTQGYKQNLLGLANIIEPGIFDLQQMSTLETPGLVLFLHLPAPVEAREAFDLLLQQGKALADRLEADLCDDARNRLTNQSIGHLKEKVEAYRFKQKMTQIKHRRN